MSALLKFGSCALAAGLFVLSVVHWIRGYLTAKQDAATSAVNEEAERQHADAMTVAEAKARAAREGKFDAKVAKVTNAAGAARLLRDVSGDSETN